MAFEKYQSKPMRSQRRKVTTKANSKKLCKTSSESVLLRVGLVLLALIACALPALFVNDIIGWLPLLVVVLALVVSFAYLQVIKRAFTFSEGVLAARCIRGSEIDFELHFINDSPLIVPRLIAYIYVSDLFDQCDDVTTVPLTLLPKEDKTFHFQATFDHLGTYSAGVEKIVLFDPLGLFSKTIVNPNRHQVEVLPRLVNLEAMSLSSLVTSESITPRQALLADDMDYAGVREYTWGDPIKSIHWKLSSRNPDGAYLTRLYEAFDNPGVSIIVDTTAPDYDTESLMGVYDGLVESALSFNEYARSLGLDSEIAFRACNGEDVKIRVTDMRDYPDLACRLPRIAPGDCSGTREVLKREMNALHGQDNIVLCTAHIDDEMIAMLIALKLRKRNPLLVLVVPFAMDSYERKAFTRPLEQLDAARIPCYVLTAAIELASAQEVVS